MKWKNYKIFVSSTFKDMDTERDMLKNVVEPQLNEALAENMCSVEFVDLRHSVKTDSTMPIEQRERQIFNVCIDEIDKCEPFFVGLLGHRYGWIPGRELIARENVSLPDTFPIALDDISVTAYEYLHGIFAHGSSQKCVVFLRDEASYAEVEETQLSEYIEEKELQKDCIGKLRNYVKDSDVKSVDYILDVTSGLEGKNIDCVTLFKNTIQDMIVAEMKESDNNDICHYDIEHEALVQQHLKVFKGRERELEECQRKLDAREFCILATTENGVGRTAFICKIYDLYRQNPNNVCLIYLPDTTSSYTNEDAIFYWNLELDRRLNAEYKERIVDGRGDVECQRQLFTDLAQLLKEKEQALYVFIDGVFPSGFLNMDGHLMLATMIAENNDLGLAPLMYKLQRLSRDARQHILHDLRPSVANVLIDKPCSSDTRWLSRAHHIMQCMTKYDFAEIRGNQGAGDNEKVITAYQEQLAASLPEESDSLLAFWIDKIGDIVTSRTVRDYVYLMGISAEGWTDDMMCSILECEAVVVSMLRQMLGREIIRMGDDGKYHFCDYAEVQKWIGAHSLQENWELLDKACRAVVRENIPKHKNHLFLLSLLADRRDYCVQMIKTDFGGDEELKDAALQSLVWLSKHYLLDFNRVMSMLVDIQQLADYDYAVRFINMLKRIGLFLSSDTYEKLLIDCRKHLRILNLQRQITSEHYMLVCEVLACSFDFYRYISDWNHAHEIIQEGLSISADYVETTVSWQVYYVYFVFRELGFAHDEDLRSEIINNMFVRKVADSDIVFASNADTTCHSILYLMAAELYVSSEKEVQAEEFCSKALELSIILAQQKDEGFADTSLDTLSVKRNLLNNYEMVQIIHKDYGIFTNAQMVEWHDRIIPLVKDFVVMTEDDDRIRYLYYAVQLRHLVDSTDDVETCIEKLKTMSDEITGAEEMDMIMYAVHERQTPVMVWKFKAWLFINVMILRTLAEHKHMSIMSYDEVSGILLPIVGAKLSADNEENDVQCEIAEQLYNLFVAMAIHEMNKDDDRKPQTIASLLCSAHDVYEQIPVRDYVYRVAYNEELASLQQLSERIYDNCRDIIDSNRPYTDFSDCFGLPGDYFASDDGMWANGDPELAIRTEITDDGLNLRYSKEELEELIDNEEYETIIDELGTMDRLGFSELYYLALAYLRTDQFVKASNVISVVPDEDHGVIPASVSDGDLFSSDVLCLTALLLAHEFGIFEDYISSADEEFLADEDIAELVEAYENYKKNVSNLEDISLPKPYGYKL